MVATEPLASRPLEPDDASAAFALSTEAGWNQTIEDWRFMIDAGETRGQFTAAGGLVASALILPYGDRIAWIAMVLTTQAHRRRGLATDNLRWAIERCDARGLIAGLDATPAGREFYAPLGFTDCWGLRRLRAERPLLAETRARGAVIRPMQPDDLAAIAALDADAFGARRNGLLAHLHRRQPACAWVAHEPGGGLAGFLLGRDGRATLHLGPLIAGDQGIAAELVGRALAQTATPVSMDVPDGQGMFRTLLVEAGFAQMRPFTRMLRCSKDAPGRADRCFAIAGPELG